MNAWKTLWAALILVIAAGPALAQTAVDPKQKAAVKELLHAMDFKQMMGRMAGAMSQNFPQMIEPMLDKFASADKKLTAEQKAEARKIAMKIQASIAKDIHEIYNDPQVAQEMENIMAQMYGKYFTVNEIKAITAFYKSPAGKKAMNVMPQMMQEAMPKIMATMTPKITAMAEKVAKDVVKEVENKAVKDAEKTDKGEGGPADKSEKVERSDKADKDGKGDKAKE